MRAGPYRPSTMTTDDAPASERTGFHGPKPPAALTVGATAGPSPRTMSAAGEPQGGPAASVRVGVAAVVPTLFRTRAASVGLTRSAATTFGASLVSAVHVPTAIAGCPVRRRMRSR